MSVLRLNYSQIKMIRVIIFIAVVTSLLYMLSFVTILLDAQVQDAFYGVITPVLFLSQSAFFMLLACWLYKARGTGKEAR